jgi:hypothetical protein
MIIILIFTMLASLKIILHNCRYNKGKELAKVLGITEEKVSGVLRSN